MTTKLHGMLWALTGNFSGTNIVFGCYLILFSYSLDDYCCQLPAVPFMHYLLALAIFRYRRCFSQNSHFVWSNSVIQSNSCDNNTENKTKSIYTDFESFMNLESWWKKRFILIFNNFKKVSILLKLFSFFTLFLFLNFSCNELAVENQQLNVCDYIQSC